MKVALLVAAAIFFSHASAMYILANPRESNCVYEDHSLDTLVKGEFKSTKEPAGVMLSIEVLSPSGHKMYSKKDVQTGKFSYTTVEEGTHSICFITSTKHPVVGTTQKKRIYFTIAAGAAANDYKELAKVEHLDPVAVELRRMEDSLAELLNDVTEMKVREMRHRDTNESTNTRVVVFSLFSMSVMIGVGVWQVMYLKSYFKAKKLA
uniref:GOLD domain-containing protein n=1 Tax=Palpitomonas bilix TaxID=652834 RepID=A0A7S3D8Z3_9EUKA|mmetsp:Transcript_26790/g.68854  ORF Transcript_26790/g.68854 Transcript_26790/m.68854 type:complete len:207 (+) Transcript_26790:113-733(+)